MPKKIFIGGLSIQTNETSVSEAFQPFGRIVALALSTDRDGRTQSAELDYAEPDSGSAAIAKMDGATLDGSVVQVSGRR